MLARPDPSEHDAYYSLYIDRVPDGDLLERMSREVEVTRALLARIPAEREQHRYAPGKWSIREVVGHLIDVERTLAYRALFFSRGDGAPMPGFDQEVWNAGANHEERPLAELSEELAAIRASHLVMFQSFTDAMWLRTGVASGLSFTARSFPWILQGHELHHRAILEERYLG